eukprot:scaffold15303_cov122-Isochrysis_galbana.AAC.3
MSPGHAVADARTLLHAAHALPWADKLQPAALAGLRAQQARLLQLRMPEPHAARAVGVPAVAPGEQGMPRLPPPGATAPGTPPDRRPASRAEGPAGGAGPAGGGRDSTGAPDASHLFEDRAGAGEGRRAADGQPRRSAHGYGRGGGAGDGAGVGGWGVAARAPLEWASGGETVHATGGRVEEGWWIVTGAPRLDGAREPEIDGAAAPEFVDSWQPEMDGAEEARLEWWARGGHASGAQRPGCVSVGAGAPASAAQSSSTCGACEAVRSGGYGSDSGRESVGDGWDLVECYPAGWAGGGHRPPLSYIVLQMETPSVHDAHFECTPRVGARTTHAPPARLQPTATAGVVSTPRLAAAHPPPASDPLTHSLGSETTCPQRALPHAADGHAGRGHGVGGPSRGPRAHGAWRAPVVHRRLGRGLLPSARNRRAGGEVYGLVGGSGKVAGDWVADREERRIGREDCPDCRAVQCAHKRVAWPGRRQATGARAGSMKVHESGRMERGGGNTRPAALRSHLVIAIVW